jgi:hypothetical protein
MVDREARCVTETEEMHVDAAFEAEDAEEHPVVLKRRPKWGAPQGLCATVGVPLSLPLFPMLTLNLAGRLRSHGPFYGLKKLKGRRAGVQFFHSIFCGLRALNRHRFFIV